MICIYIWYIIYDIYNVYIYISIWNNYIYTLYIYMYMHIYIKYTHTYLHLNWILAYVYFAIQQYLHFACNIPLAVGRIFHYTTNKHIKRCIDMFLVAKQFGPIVWNCPSSSKPTLPQTKMRRLHRQLSRVREVFKVVYRSLPRAQWKQIRENLETLIPSGKQT